MQRELTCIAVDWSGARVGAQKRIWLAAARAGQLIRLENGRTATDLTTELIECAAGDSAIAVGLDFAFSFPEWFLDDRLATTAHDLWRLAEHQGEGWLSACEPPFWGRPGRPRPPGDVERGYRLAEYELRPRPKSVFQIGGSGTVGTGSVRGMPMLLRLHEAGFSIWPYDSPSLPVAIEIYPRLMTGPVVKSDPVKRRRFLVERYPHLEGCWIEIAASSDDAFDAAVSAMVMSEHSEALSSLPEPLDPVTRREGCIWYPGLTDGALTPTASAP